MSQTSKVTTLGIALVVALHGSSFAAAHDAMVRTPMSRTELMSALRDGHIQAFGREPSVERLAMAWSQVATENDMGRLVYNHNLGNVGASGPGQATYFSKGDKHVYRSYATFAEGAAAYWAVIKGCPMALQQFDAGDAAQSAVGLKRCRYFEADVEPYAKRLVYLYDYATKHVLVEEERERREQEAAVRNLVDAATRPPAFEACGD